MELPFAVQSSSDNSLPSKDSKEVNRQQGFGENDDDNDNDACSLVTASSQGSFLHPQYSDFEAILEASPSSPHRLLHPPQQHHNHHHRPEEYSNNANNHVLAEEAQSNLARGGYAIQEQHSTTSSKLAAASSSLTSSLAATGSRVASVFSNLTAAAPVTNAALPETIKKAKSTRSQQQQHQQHPVEAIDFTYVNVLETDEDEVDIVLPHHGTLDDSIDQPTPSRGDILTLLLNHIDDDSLVADLEQANRFVTQAAEAKQAGHLQQALDHHTAAAKIFHQAAVSSKEHHASMAESLLLLSQIQAKSALALKRVVKLRPKSLSALLQQTSGTSERLRAKVRGALNNRAEADLSESTFLGRANATTGIHEEEKHDASSIVPSEPTAVSSITPSHNPVDEMMALERELRDMDMTLELESSIASLDARNQNRVKNMDGSFMVVAPGSQSYMSSSAMWSSPPPTAPPPARNTALPATGTAVARARANRVQVSTSRPHPPSSVPPNKHVVSHGLESSFFDSAILTSSVASLAGSVAHHDGGGGGGGGGGNNSIHAQQQTPANTKQLMRLMDSLKTLGDENATLLRQVQEAEAARVEAKMTQDKMSRFKEDYNHKFKALREALKKFREEHPGGGHESSSSSPSSTNPVASSEFARSASVTDQLQRQEQLIRKLTADLKKEKEESKKKDAALRKYENFYREVKARSAQKAAQRQRDASNRPRSNLSRR